MDLFYPELAVQLGSYCLQSGVKMMVVSCQDSSFDWAKIQFTEQLQEAVTLVKMDEVTVSMGYDGEFSPVFTGYLTNDFALSDGANELLAKDAAIKLEEIIVSNTFVDVQPSEIVEYCCRQAGLEYKLPPTQYPQRSYPVMSENALKVIGGLGAIWGIAPLVYLRNGVLHWDVPTEQTQIYVFEYSLNIISLTKDAGYWCLETVSTPFIRHSDRIGVKHPELTGTFTVYKVIFSSNEQNFVRTQIYFKEAVV